MDLDRDEIRAALWDSLMCLDALYEIEPLPPYYLDRLNDAYQQIEEVYLDLYTE